MVFQSGTKKAISSKSLLPTDPKDTIRHPTFKMDKIKPIKMIKRTLKMRTCRNCGITGCAGAFGNGQRGKKCKTLCTCGTENCFGGKSITCIQDLKRYVQESIQIDSDDDSFVLGSSVMPFVDDSVVVVSSNSIDIAQFKNVAELMGENMKEDNRVILTLENTAKMRPSDFYRFNPGQWLSDECINYYLKLMLNEISNSPEFPRTLILNTFFYFKLESQGAESVRKWIKVFNINLDRSF
jgi:hypothetical protein